MSVFTLDGKAYNVFVPADGIRRSGQILDGENAGRTLSGMMIRDIIGTYYNYSISIDTQQLQVEEYDALYDAVTAPVDYHELTVPYGQGELSFRAYITGAEDVLKTMESGINRWGDLTLSFVAMAPQRRP